MHKASHHLLVLAAFAALASAFALSGCQQSSHSYENRGSTHTLTAYANSIWALSSWTSSDGKNYSIPSSPPTLELGYQGSISGLAGVNRYFGSVRVKDGKLDWGELASTRMAGDPELMESETRYLNDLKSTTKVTVRGNNLVFTGKDGLRLQFSRARP